MPLLSTFGAASARGWKPVGPPKYTGSAAEYLAVAGGTSGGANGTAQSYSGGQGAFVYGTFSLTSSGTITVGAAGNQSAVNTINLNAPTGTRPPADNQVYNAVYMYGPSMGVSNQLTFTTGTSQFYGNKANWGYFAQVAAYDYWGSLVYVPLYGGNAYTSQTLPNPRLSDGTQNYAQFGLNGSTQFLNTLIDYGYGTRNFYYSSNASGATSGSANTGIGGMSSASNNGTAGTGYSGFVEIAYPNTYAQLTATTGTVQYFNYNGKHVYRWLTSGSYTV